MDRNPDFILNEDKRVHEILDKHKREKSVHIAGV